MFKFLSRSSEPTEAAAPDRPASGDGPGRAARRELLELIGDFLVRHDLDITSGNLAFAYAAFPAPTLASPP